MRLGTPFRHRSKSLMRRIWRIPVTLDELLDYPPYIAFQLDSWLMSMQSLTGIGFNQDGARELVASVTVEMDAIASEIEPQLPPKPLNKGELKEWTLPAKPFKKDGSLSASMEAWLSKRGAMVEGGEVLLDGERYPLVGGGLTKTTGRMTLANQDDLKNWLVGSGWLPTLWNVKKDARGKPERDERGQMIRTTPKMQENGRLCPNLEEMGGDLIRPVVRWLSLRNRRSVVEGWLANERLAFDGRLGAGASGVTPTFRKKHSTVVNLPKADGKVILGVEMRSLFRAQRPGYVLVGYDASGLEARVEGHYTKPYPGGEAYAHDLLEGDIHLRTAEVIFRGKLEPLMGLPDYGKNHLDVKDLRNKAKTVKYAVTYGASPTKLAATLGEPSSRGEEIYNGFWEAAAPLAHLRDRLTQHWETNNKRWIRGLDGRRIMTRHKHALINSLFQSAGAIVFAYAGLIMSRWLGGLTAVDEYGNLCYSYKSHRVYRVAEMHDEAVLEVPEHLAEEIKQMGERSLEAAGRHLKMRVPIIGDGAIGPTWASVH
jgi:hypothetical protein